MIKVVFGNKGIGKTKYLIEDANSLVEKCKGDIVFIDRGRELLTEIRHEIRYIDIQEFIITNTSAFLGFICGLIAEDYDIEAVYVDGIKSIIKDEDDTLAFFDGLKQINDKFSINFIISLCGDIKEIPDYVTKEYTC
mgnify:CR=1 FL=1